MENNKLTLCIPRINNKISSKEIFKKLIKLKIGYILKLIEIPIKNSNDYKRIILIIEFTGDKGKQMEEYLKKGNTLKIVYDDPWYWKLLLYKKEQ